MDDTSHYYRMRTSFTYNTSTSSYEWNWKDVIQHYSGDPLSVCSNCSKRDNCNEECMKKEYENIKPPKNFIIDIMGENDNYFFGSRFGNSMPHNRYFTREKEVVVHYSGDPLEICQTCSKFLRCKEECLSDEGIQPPKHFEKAFELDEAKMFEDYINSRYYAKDYEYTKYYNEFRIL